MASRRTRDLVALVAISVVYFAAGKLGLELAFVAEQVSVVWPPSGIALAAILLFGRRMWPAIAVGAFAVNVFTKEPVITAFGIATGNMLEAYVASLLLERARFRGSLARVRDVIALLLLAAMASTTVSATLGVLSLCAGGVQPWSAFGSLWRVWWLGDAVGDLVIVPLCVTAVSLSFTRPTARQLFETTGIALGLSVISTVMFARHVAPPFHDISFAYTVFPLVIWTALRLGPFATSVVVFIASSVAIGGTLLGFGPFADGAVGERLIVLQLFTGVVGATGLLLAAATAERQAVDRHRSVAYAVARILAEAASLPEAVPKILRTIQATLGWDAGALWRIDRETERLRVVDVASSDHPAHEEFVAETRAMSIEPGVGLPGTVWATGEPAWIVDVTRADNFPRFASARRAGLHGAFATPIVLGNEMLGVVEFFSDEYRPPDEDLLALMHSLGSQIGLFIERTRADEGREEHLRRERAARAEAERLYQEAREADRHKDEFLAMLSHELRAPLAPMRNALYSMERSGGGPASATREILSRQLETLTSLVDDLLDVSRITRGKVQLERGVVALGDVVARAAETARPWIEANAHELEIVLPDAPIHLDADPTRLEQVLANLLNNAAKYTERGGLIRLTAERDGTSAVVRVRDNGIGIPGELLPRVFDLFTQAERSLDRAQGGLGIGLTLVKSLVEQHGGEVTAASEGPGRGSEFVVRLPALPASEARSTPQVAEAVGSALTSRAPLPAGHVLPAPGPSAAPEVPSPSLLRVLVVDDNVDAATSLAAIIACWGHDVRLAHDGREALRTAEEFEPDVFLLDIGLPGMDGYQIARKLREEDHRKDALLIAITGYGREEDRRKAKAASFDHHLVKPVDPQHLSELISSQTARRRDLRAALVPS